MSGRINNQVAKLIIEGLRRCAPGVLPEHDELARLTEAEAGVPLEPYRALLERARQLGGGACLLEAGRALDQLVDPILFVLLNSDSVQVLIEKEARLGRFIHSRHVVRILEEQKFGMLLEHVSLNDEAPLATENLAAAGQHVALLEQLGCIDLRLRFPESEAPQREVYDQDGYHEPAKGKGFERWLFTWQRFEASRRPLPGLDELLLAKETRSELTETPAPVLAVENVVLTDLARTWSLADVAERLDSSTRSLQRALANHDTRFSAVVDRVRLEEARRLLIRSDLSVTEIGYVCGFADTSHFSRRCRQRFGTPPSKLRAHLSGGGNRGT